LIVLDASAALAWLLNQPAGVRIAERITRGDAQLHAPHLLDLEIAQVLRRYVASSDISSTRVDQAFEDLKSLAIVRYPHDMLLPRIWELRSSLTAYDAAYVALAEALDAPLLTCDGKLARSHGHDAKIELFGS
jgi:predicted nucleic acid-binding protein